MGLPQASASPHVKPPPGGPKGDGRGTTTPARRPGRGLDEGRRPSRAAAREGAGLVVVGGGGEAGPVGVAKGVL